MVATVNSASTVNSATGLSTATSGAGQTSAQEQSDRFLKLLVAQLNNQDPMNPMDNAQMTSQMAQINTVSGIQQLNETMKSMSSQFTAMQVLQGASMVGREVLTDGNTLAVKDGVGKGSLDLAGNADKVTVQVLTQGGQMLGNVNLGATSAGRHNFEWDASSYTGASAPVFKVTATQGTKAVAATPLARSAIESVSTNAGAMSLSLKNGAVVAYDAIKAIL
jgi:flagellar basal-body rod modification protein FlgD